MGLAACSGTVVMPSVWWTVTPWYQSKSEHFYTPRSQGEALCSQGEALGLLDTLF